MNNYYYKKTNKKSYKTSVRFVGLLLFLTGILGVLYTFFPLLSWQLYFAPAFAASDIESPIPKTTVVNESTIHTLFANSKSFIQGVDYSNAQNWFPGAHIADSSKPLIAEYTISIPSLNIQQAVVSTQDYDLSKHLINYPGTGIPGQNGTAVIFGHSSLPQLFDPKDYDTIFATAYRLQVGDEIIAKVENAQYTYRISSITVVDPTNTSIFTQQYDNSYITLVTCTPPGTTWKRLIIKAALQNI